MADQGQTRPRPAGWKRDPYGRHYARYWDGELWTDQVANEQRERSIDPPGNVVPSPAVIPARAPATLPARQRPERLASERVVVAAPMSFAGSAGRLWKMTVIGPPAAKVATIPTAIMLVLMAWMVVVCWYVCFGLLLVPYRLVRRGGRKRKRDNLRHQETLRAIERRP